MRQFLLNLLTVTGTGLVLGALAFFIYGLVEGDEEVVHPPTPTYPSEGVSEPPVASQPPSTTPPVETPVAQVSQKRWLGVTTSPWDTEEWQREGLDLDAVANYIAWSNNLPLEESNAEAERRGLMRFITWEPWLPARDNTHLRPPQPYYSNARIAKGLHDRYIISMAKTLGAFEGRVFLRYAHEMEGAWYPWHYDAKSYIKAWQRIHDIFARYAPNVYMVWSPNRALQVEKTDAWERRVRAYWPGADYVDYVGLTVIARKGRGMNYFAPRIEVLRNFGKPAILSEVYVPSKGRLSFLQDLRHYVCGRTWIKGIVWSEGPNRPTLRTYGASDFDLLRGDC